MSRRKKDPLRPLTDSERLELTRLSRSQAAPAVQVARAIMLLAVAHGDDYQQAALVAGRRSGDAVSHLVARFNAEGLAALSPRHGGGQPRTYGPASRERILRRVRREPTPGGRWHGHLVALDTQGDAPIGPRWPAQGRRPRRSGRCSTRPAKLPAEPHLVPHRRPLRKRVGGTVVVTDPDAEPKKS